MATNSLADLLKVLLSIDDSVPVFGSSGFTDWGVDKVLTARLADAAPEAIWLLDSRDTGAVSHLRAIAADGHHVPAAVLVLTSTAPLRDRVKSGIRSRSRPRLPRAKVVPIARSLGLTWELDLGFHDGQLVPTDYQIPPISGDAGSALLLTAEPAFSGPVWRMIRDLLGEEVRVTAVHLRARGAVVVSVRGESGDYVVRLVPPGPMQNIVSRNHERLSALLQAARERGRPLTATPRPIFAANRNGVLLLGETLLPGSLAWRIPGVSTRESLYRQALSWLDAFREATAHRIPPGGPELRKLMNEDRILVDGAGFASEYIRGRVRAELDYAEEVLSEVDLVAHASHGDFGFGNLLADPATGGLTGVIDWDTARIVDIPGIDRVNFEIQMRHGGRPRIPLPQAIADVWNSGSVSEALEGAGGAARVRALFGVAVSRYITRTMRYPVIFERLAARFDQSLRWMDTIEAPLPKNSPISNPRI